jgi:hypothetical protein
MPVVDIGGTDYEVYEEQTDVATYLAASLGASDWAALEVATGQRQAMVSATRMFDRTVWAGDKTAESQPIAHPRTGLTDLEGDAVPSTEIAPDILEAFAELCEELAGDPDSVQDNPTTGSNEKRLKAGSVEVERFRPTDRSASRWPQRVLELIKPFLGSPSSLAYPLASGVDGEMSYDGDSYQLTGGFA